MVPRDKDKWDAALREECWRNSVEKSRQAFAKLEANPSTGFYLLCLAEVDAISSFNAPDCFNSRVAFVAELRRLIAAPTTPSRPIPNLQAYKDSQKWFLQHEIEQCEAEA